MSSRRQKQTNKKPNKKIVERYYTPPAYIYDIPMPTIRESYDELTDKLVLAAERSNFPEDAIEVLKLTRERQYHAAMKRFPFSYNPEDDKFGFMSN